MNKTYATNKLKWLLPVAPFSVCYDVFKQKFNSCMKVGSGEDLDLSREDSKKLLYFIHGVIDL